MSEPKYKLVPVSQLDKVESIRLALHSIADWLDSQEMNLSALRVRGETQKLWDVANRKYQDVAPSPPQDPRDESIANLDAALRRVADALTGKACGGVDTADEINPETGEPFGPGGHTGWVLAEEARKLKEALRVAREALVTAKAAIAQAPEDAFGAVEPNYDGETGYFLRDELVSRMGDAILKIKELMGEK